MKLFSFTIIAIVIAIMTLSGCSDGKGNTPASNNLNLPNAPYGLCLSPYPDGLNPENGDNQTVPIATKLVGIIRPYVQAVLLYTCKPLADSTESVASLSKKAGLYVAAGPWLASNLATNTVEINYALDEKKKGNVDLLVAGFEPLFRNDFSPEKLIEYIKILKAAGGPVAVDDTANEIENHPEVVAEADAYMINKYGFWEGNDPEVAYKNFVATVERLQAKYPGKELIVGETGYPSAGDAFEGAEPSLANMLYYAEKVLMYCKLHNIRIFYFEAFDEPWKPRANPVGPNWGFWTKDLVMKPGVLEIFKKTPVPDVPDNGTEPVVSIIADESCAETNDNYIKTVRVTLSTVSTKTITVKYTTVNDTAVSSIDFTATSGTLTISAGSKTADISVPIIADTIREPDKSFKIVLSEPTNATLGNATSTIIIQNDDPAPEVVLPKISAADLSVSEGFQNNIVNLTVTLDKTSTKNVTVEYSTVGGTAAAMDDYLTAAGSLIFTPGQTSKTIPVVIFGELLNENDETFKLVLSAPSNATLDKSEGVVTIVNDDRPLGMEWTYCPKIGEKTNLRGQCFGLKPDDYKVVVYINVGGGWWIKPTFITPKTTIGVDGKWVCDITTDDFDPNGKDVTATQVAIFLIPSSYTPVSAGGGALPQDVKDHAAIAPIIIDRNSL